MQLLMQLLMQLGHSRLDGAEAGRTERRLSAQAATVDVGSDQVHGSKSVQCCRTCGVPAPDEPGKTKT